MRVLVIVLSLVSIVVLGGFALTNLSTRVPVTLLNTQYPDVPLYLVVILAVSAGVVLTGVIAVAEGANIRLANRRLRREIHKLETEINYLRTQGPSVPTEDLGRETGSAETEPRRAALPLPTSAPEYGGGGDDDDVYSGGRAV